MKRYIILSPSPNWQDEVRQLRRASSSYYVPITNKLDTRDIIERMYQVTTSDMQRRQLWQRLFGRAELPVLNARPRLQELPGRSVLAYDLALQTLHAGDRARLAAYAARRYGLDYDHARRTLESEATWPIEDRGDLKLVAEQSPAFVLRGLLPNHGGAYA